MCMAIGGWWWFVFGLCLVESSADTTILHLETGAPVWSGSCEGQVHGDPTLSSVGDGSLMCQIMEGPHQPAANSCVSTVPPCQGLYCFTV